MEFVQTSVRACFGRVWQQLNRVMVTHNQNLGVWYFLPETTHRFESA
jgi:hypothetical protein